MAWAATKRCGSGARCSRPPRSPTDHPSSMAFVPGAPTKASVLFDLVVGASLDDRGGLDRRRGRDLGREPGAALGRRPGGLSARSAAGCSSPGARPATCRRWWPLGRPPTIDGRPAVGRMEGRAGRERALLDRDRDPRDGRRRRCGAGRRPRAGSPARRSPQTLDARRGRARGVFAVVASAGATNAGTVDDLAGVADVCAERGIWLHVDGAYGGAGAGRALRPRALRRDRARRLASSSIRTSGCSRPTTAAPCSTATPNGRAACSARKPSYLDTVNQEAPPGTSGTRPTTPTT